MDILTEEMQNKQREQYASAHEVIGKALDGMPIFMALSILANTARSVVLPMPEFIKEKNIKIFSDIMRSKDEEEPKSSIIQ